MKILITGSTGFIGYHLSKKLLDVNNYVIGVDNLSQLKETFHLKRKKFKIPKLTFQKMNKIINPYLWK